MTLLKYDFIIVIINYKSFDYTKRCIESIEKVSNENFQIVLVDNGSDQKELINEFCYIQKNISPIFLEENIGFGRANNKAIEFSKQNFDFKFIVLLNNDTTVNSGWLSQLSEPFEKSKSIGITTGTILFDDKTHIWYEGSNINKLRMWPSIKNYKSNKNLIKKSLNRNVEFISGCLMMFSRNSIDLIKGFDERIFMYCEDLEMCLRATKIGLTLKYVPECIIYHSVEGSSKVKSNKTNLKFVWYHTKINHFLCIVKHLNGKDRFFTMFYFFTELSIKTLLFVFKGKPEAVLVFYKILKNTLFTKRVNQYN
jgi:GT2 family glycosyltransferase